EVARHVVVHRAHRTVRIWVAGRGRPRSGRRRREAWWASTWRSWMREGAMRQPSAQPLSARLHGAYSRLRRLSTQGPRAWKVNTRKFWVARAFAHAKRSFGAAP